MLDGVINDRVRTRTRQANTAAGTGTVVAVDGNEVRGAKNAGAGRMFLFAALDHVTGTVIGQESIGEKTNEIPHFGALMGKIGDLGDVVFTVDASHVMASIRNLAISEHRLQGETNIAKALRTTMRHPEIAYKLVNLLCKRPGV